MFKHTVFQFYHLNGFWPCVMYYNIPRSASLLPPSSWPHREVVGKGADAGRGYQKPKSRGHCQPHCRTYPTLRFQPLLMYLIPPLMYLHSQILLTPTPCTAPPLIVPATISPWKGARPSTKRLGRGAIRSDFILSLSNYIS